MIVVGLRTTSAASTAEGPRAADILVPEVARDLPERGTLGSVVATSTGDLAGATDMAALRTRVLRLLSNVEDAYAHLRGWGARPAKAALARPSDLARAQIQTTQRLLADPDIVDATVTIRPAPQGVRRVFHFDVVVTTRGGVTDRIRTEE